MRSETVEPKAGEVLDVWFEDRMVGHISRRSPAVADIDFTYSQAWRDGEQSFPISTRMPLSEAVHEPAVAYPWFMNLLPEGKALAAISSILKVHELDVFGMMGEMGRDLPGALDIRRPDLDLEALKPRYHRLSEAELANAIRALPERPVLVGVEGMHMSAAGAQDKLPVVRYKDGGLGLGLDGAASTHILKPRNKKFAASVENEAFCLRLAALSGLSVARASIGRVEDIDYLLVERYDRMMDGKRLRRLHQEDMCQATGFLPFLKYEWNADTAQQGPSLRHCMDALTATTPAAVNKLRFFEMMLFNVLCGNVDAHSKNYSILIKPGGTAMAPLYDVMSGDIYPNVTRNLAIKIATKQRGGHIHGRHWDRFAEENGLSAKLVRRRVAEISEAVLKAVPIAIEEMGQSVMKSGAYAEIGEHVSGYCRRMIANLKTDPAPEGEDIQGDLAYAAEPPDEIVISP